MKKLCLPLFCSMATCKARSIWRPSIIAALVLVMSLDPGGPAGAKQAPPSPPRIWLNHLKLLPGDASVQVSRAAAGDPYGGVAGLVVTSATAGNQGAAGGDKVIWMALQSAPHWYIETLSLCYQVYNTTAEPTSIDLIKVSQVQDPPNQAVVLLAEDTNWTDPGPVCARVQVRPWLNPKNGPLYLALRVNFASPDDVIVVRGLRLVLDQHFPSFP